MKTNDQCLRLCLIHVCRSSSISFSLGFLLLWHPSLGTSWLNISSSVRSRSDLYLSSANRQLSEEEEEEGECALPAQQAKKTLYRTTVIQFVRCLQITSLAIDLDIFKLNEVRSKRWMFCWALIICWLIRRDILVHRSLFIFSRLRCACSSVC